MNLSGETSRQPSTGPDTIDQPLDSGSQANGARIEDDLQPSENYGLPSERLRSFWAEVEVHAADTVDEDARARQERERFRQARAQVALRLGTAYHDRPYRRPDFIDALAVSGQAYLDLVAQPDIRVYAVAASDTERQTKQRTSRQSLVAREGELKKRQMTEQLAAKSSKDPAERRRATEAALAAGQQALQLEKRIADLDVREWLAESAATMELGAAMTARLLSNPATSKLGELLLAQSRGHAKERLIRFMNENMGVLTAKQPLSDSELGQYKLSNTLLRNVDLTQAVVQHPAPWFHLQALSVIEDNKHSICPVGVPVLTDSGKIARARKFRTRAMQHVQHDAVMAYEHSTDDPHVRRFLSITRAVDLHQFETAPELLKDRLTQYLRPMFDQVVTRLPGDTHRSKFGTMPSRAVAHYEQVQDHIRTFEAE